MALNDHVFDAGGAVYNVMNPEFDDPDVALRIQKALDKAGESAAHPRGAVVYLPPAYTDGANSNTGIYEIVRALNLPSNVHICGGGDGTIIRLADNVANPPTALLRPKAGPVTNVTISDLTIDGNEQGYEDAEELVCVRLNRGPNNADSEVSYVRVERVTFRNVHTVAVHANSNTDYVSDVRITDCVVENSRFGGISLFGKFKNFVIANNRLSNLADDAIAIQGVLVSDVLLRPRDIVVRNNVMYDLDRRTEVDTFLSTPHGIIVFSADSVAITGNTIDNTVASGIYVSLVGTDHPSRNVVITGNVVRRAGRATTDSAVRSNGIDVLSGRNVVVCGNSVRGTRGHGITVTGCERVTLTGNELSENDSSGIYIEPSRDVTVHGNTISDNGISTSPEPYGIALIAAATTAPKSIVISGNRVGNSASNGLSVFRQQAGIFAVGNAPPGSTPSYANDLVIAGNDLRRNLNTSSVEQPILGPLENATIGATGYDRGTTTERPGWARTGQTYFDTTIGRPVWYNGTAWVQGNGS